MKGNLSKKKGFLGDITEGNLDYIASKLNTEYGKRLDTAEDNIKSVGSLASNTNDLAKANAGVLELHGGYLASAEYKENKVNRINTQSPSEKKYPSEYAVAEAIKNMKPDIDLSDYYTKDEVDNLQNRHRYYGDASIAPSDESLFVFTKDGDFAKLTGITGDIEGDIVIPYECNIDGKAYKVTGIGADVFKDQYLMPSIIIPGTVTSIGERAFYDCLVLTSIDIPEGVTTIEKSTFEECTAIEKVTLPGTITAIKEDAFEGCFSVTDVYYAGTKEQWKKISIEGGNEALEGTIRYGQAPAKLSDIENMLGDIDTAIKNVMDKYGIGGDVT